MRSTHPIVPVVFLVNACLLSAPAERGFFFQFEVAWEGWWATTPLTWLSALRFSVLAFCVLMFCRLCLPCWFGGGVLALDLGPKSSGRPNVACTNKSSKDLRNTIIHSVNGAMVFFTFPRTFVPCLCLLLPLYPAYSVTKRLYMWPLTVFGRTSFWNNGLEWALGASVGYCAGLWAEARQPGAAPSVESLAESLPLWILGWTAAALLMGITVLCAALLVLTICSDIVQMSRASEEKTEN